jgi:hypothetical protein
MFDLKEQVGGRHHSKIACLPGHVRIPARTRFSLVKFVSRCPPKSKTLILTYFSQI